MTTEDLLVALSANTDLTRFVTRVSEDRLPWVVVSPVAVAAWEREHPDGWAKVSQWLAAKNVAVVRI